MARKILIGGLYFIGIAAVIIATSIALFGISSVGDIFATVLDPVLGSGPMTDLGTPNDDSELRFYSVFFVAYGCVLVAAARNLDGWMSRVPLLLGLFFVGGLARALGYISVGKPHALFVLLMLIELILPIILYASWRRIAASQT